MGTKISVEIKKEQDYKQQDPNCCILKYLNSFKINVTKILLLKDGRFAGIIDDRVIIFKRNIESKDIESKDIEFKCSGTPLELYETQNCHLVVFIKEQKISGKVIFLKIISQFSYKEIFSINFPLNTYYKDYKIGFEQSKDDGTIILGYSNKHEKILYLELYYLLFYKCYNDTYELMRKIEFRLQEANKPILYILGNEQVLIKQNQILYFYNFNKSNLIYKYKEKEDNNEIQNIFKYAKNMILINSLSKTILYNWKTRNNIMVIPHTYKLIIHFVIKGIIIGHIKDMNGNLKLYLINDKSYKEMQDLYLKYPPSGIDILSNNDNLYIADLNNHMLLEYKINI